MSNRDNLTFGLVFSMHHASTFSITEQNVSWFCSAVYASLVFTARCQLWDHLGIVRSSSTGPRAIIGDMNEIVMSTEVSGGNFNTSRAALFPSVITIATLLTCIL